MFHWLCVSSAKLVHGVIYKEGAAQALGSSSVSEKTTSHAESWTNSHHGVTSSVVSFYRKKEPMVLICV